MRQDVYKRQDNNIGNAAYCFRYSLHLFFGQAHFIKFHLITVTFQYHTIHYIINTCLLYTSLTDTLDNGVSTGVSDTETLSCDTVDVRLTARCAVEGN